MKSQLSVKQRFCSYQKHQCHLIVDEKFHQAGLWAAIGLDLRKPGGKEDHNGSTLGMRKMSRVETFLTLLATPTLLTWPLRLASFKSELEHWVMVWLQCTNEKATRYAIVHLNMQFGFYSYNTRQRTRLSSEY